MDVKAKLILVLGTLTLFLIVADLSSELAKDKDEIGFFQAALENLDDVGSHNPIVDIIIPPAGTVVLLQNDFIVQATTPFVHPERGPPLS